MERKDWTLRVYKRDLRCKSGERKVNEYHYNDWTQDQMAEEVRDLRNTLYRAEQGWRLEFTAAWIVVKNMITGKDVVIGADAKGTCCDPSQERFWSM